MSPVSNVTSVSERILQEWKPNAALQAWGTAEATQERRLFPVACKRWLGCGYPVGCGWVPFVWPLPCPCALLLDHLIRQDEERRGDG